MQGSRFGHGAGRGKPGPLPGWRRSGQWWAREDGIKLKWAPLLVLVVLGGQVWDITSSEGFEARLGVEMSGGPDGEEVRKQIGRMGGSYT